MKFTINSSILAEAIVAGASSVPSRPTAPILSGVLVEANIAAVTFASFNYDRSTKRVVWADIATPDTALVSGRLLTVVAGNLPKNAESTVTVEGSEMVIATGRTVYRLPTMPAEDYPKLPTMGGDDVIGTLGCAELAESVRIIGGFASTDLQTEALKNLTALSIVCEPGWLTLCATDRYAVGRRRIPCECTETVAMTVVAADLLATLKAVAGVGVGDVELLCNDNQFGLRTPSTTVITRLLAEDFPNVERLMYPDEFRTTATLEVGDLSKMLKRAAAFADDEYSRVRVTVIDGELSITTDGDSVGGVTDSLPAVQHGPDHHLTVSSRRLNAALGAIDDSRVTLAFQEQVTRPLAIYPGGYEASPDGVLRPPQTDSMAVLMGIRSQS